MVEFVRDTKMVAAKGLSEIVYLAIYRIDSKYSQPFALIGSSDLGIKEESQLATFRFNVEEKPSELFVTTYAIGSEQKGVVRVHRVGPMTATFKDVANLVPAESEGLTVKSAVGGDQSFVSARSLYYKKESEPTSSKSTWVKVAVISLVVLIVIGLLVILAYWFRLFKSVEDDSDLTKPLEGEEANATITNKGDATL